MAVLKTIFLMPIRAQDKKAFSGVGSNWNPRFLNCGSDIKDGTCELSVPSIVIHEYHKLLSTLGCCEFAKKNLELVG